MEKGKLNNFSGLNLYKIKSLYNLIFTKNYIINVFKYIKS